MSVVNKTDEKVKPTRFVQALAVIMLVLIVIISYMRVQSKKIFDNAEQVANQMAEYIASNISNEVGYAGSSIELVAVSIAQSMTSDTLDNAGQIINPMISNTPFGGIEYIRPDGMNVMNIGEPFDASDRVYYIEGIKGNSGIWNNFHPRTSKETLMNFYTPLVYNGKIAGVITGYIEATSQIAPLFESNLYGEQIYGVVVDENNRVICSTIDSEFVSDLTLDMLMDQFDVNGTQKQYMKELLANATESAATYKEKESNGRVTVTLIPGTEWKVVIIIPDDSYKGIISEYITNSVIAVFLVSFILVMYATYMLLLNMKKRKDLASEKASLQEENAEIRDIIASANMGIWRIEDFEGEEPRMFVDDTMKQLLGIDDEELTPEKVYSEWFLKITEDALDSVIQSVSRMKDGSFDENTYLWNHPSKGRRYVRCGGTAIKQDGGYVLRGYHYDVDDVVREDQAKVEMLKEALDEKNEYYSTLGTLEGIFYSMHVVDLVNDTVVEFNSKDNVREFVNQKNGAVEMMKHVMTALTKEEYKQDALEFTDLTNLANRMRNKKIISKQLVGKDTGWFLASFITMEADDTGRPTKVIYTTRVIDEEKRQQESLIRKTQTDELTGLYNRRAYEEDIYAHNDTPDEDEFIYISLDVNGLKVVNDTNGHMAGDELIIGACRCMKKSLGPYGKLYRIGGDEFVAILFCNSVKLNEILADFDDTIQNWSGDLVDSLSISYGWISKYEQPDYSVRQLGAVAEERMYEAKSLHYKQSGVDRRGQKDAHKALCDLYTKILKINITDDTYQIVNMDVGEQTSEKGFDDSISGWLQGFGMSGQVHSDDLKDYLNKTDLRYMSGYFTGNKTSLHIFYRRKYEDGFKQVMMEIIPANDYTDDNQSLFLYVKNIDK